MKTFSANLSQQQLALLPTEEDIAFYEEHGWYISKPGVIPDEIIDRAMSGAFKLYAGEKDWQLPVNSGYSDWKPEDGETIRNNEFVSLQKRELRDLGLQPIIGAIAAKLARTSQIRLLDDQLVYKPPQIPNQNSTVGWHSDRAYWATCTSDKLLTAWIPFHDCDEARGPLVVLDRSHQWPQLNNLRFFNYQNLEDLENKYRAEGKKVVRVPMTLSKGQISFHNCWTIHGSYTNRSDQFRLAMAVHLQDRDNFYRSYRNQQGKEIHMFDETLCCKLPNGDPDFSDRAVFPVLWCE